MPKDIEYPGLSWLSEWKRKLLLISGNLDNFMKSNGAVEVHVI